MDTPLWTPSPARIAATTLARYMDHVRTRYDAPVTDYPTLYRWSLDCPEPFWSSVWEFCGIQATRPWQHVLEHGERMPGARWFTGSELNFAQNLLRGADAVPALVFRNEQGTRRELGYAQLRTEVARIAAGLAAAGVGRGDRVAGYLPNLPETVIAMLAAASLGAVWSSCSPDFGFNGAFDRFSQIAPTVLVAADGYWYAGRRQECLPTVQALAQRLPGLRQLVIVPYLDSAPATVTVAGVSVTAWDAFGTPGAPLRFEPVPFDHPLYILFSSGTTGVPKCIVHGVGGTLLQHLKEIVLLTDVHPGDRVFYYSTCGWMMWNWLVSALGAGATVVLYDGSPLHPDPAVLWRMAAQERLNVFGTSPRFLAASEKACVVPGRDFDLGALRILLSTGSPLAPENYRYVYQQVKADLQLSSISGGTDIISCFAFACPILPVYAGELQCRSLGMQVEIFDDDGHALAHGRGELVCTAPFPSMPVGFWNDPDGSRYHNAYFARFLGVWCHGDYAAITAHGGVIIYGRSDTVLNPGGVRIGTAEIYRQVEQLPEVIDSVAVGQDWDHDVRVVLFVHLRDGVELDEPLRQRIRERIRHNTTPRHVPAKILQVPDIPRTVSGKVVELAVRNVIHGRTVSNTDALTNPQVLQYFANREELQS